MDDSTYSFGELCQGLNKSHVYVRGLQTALDLHIPPKGARYSEAYLAFLEGIVALRTFSVSLEDIVDLFKKELKILRMLHVDSIADSPTWYLDMCSYHPDHDGRLLLTGHGLGFSTEARAIQANLDFRERPAELFKAAEMGEDIRQILARYIDLVERIRKQVHGQKEVLKTALAWSQHLA